MSYLKHEEDEVLKEQFRRMRREVKDRQVMEGLDANEYWNEVANLLLPRVRGEGDGSPPEAE